MIRCVVPEIWCVTDRIISRFGLFALLPLNSPNNQNFEKMKKNPGCTVPKICCVTNVNISFWAIFCLLPP